MSGVAVAAGRDLGGVKWINRAYWNDDDSQRSSWLAALRQHLHLKPVAMDAIDPWQTPVASAVEAVEHCSRPLLYQHSWCVHNLLATSRNDCP